MPVFHYKAVSSKGEVIEGEREEKDAAAVIGWLQGSGYIPLRAEPVEQARRRLSLSLPVHRRKTLRAADLAAMTEELAVLLKAGVSLEEALGIVRSASDGEAVTRLLDNVIDRVRNGKSFSSALEAEGETFSSLYINIIKTAEAAGALGDGLAELSEHLQREKELRDEIVSATLYPLVLFVVAIISIGLILVYVVPKISELFIGYEDMLPLSTVVVIAAADFLGAYWWAVLLALAAVVVLFQRHVQTPSGRLWRDRRLLSLPVIGDLLAKIEVARFSRSMATMLGNGVPLISALPLAAGAMSNRVLVNLIDEGIDRVKDGQAFSSMFEDSPFFPSLALQLIRVGERTGELEGMLSKVAEIYEVEARKAARRMLSILEPLMIVGLGIIIGGIIMSIMVAIISVNELPL